MHFSGGADDLIALFNFIYVEKKYDLGFPLFSLKNTD